MEEWIGLWVCGSWQSKWTIFSPLRATDCVHFVQYLYRAVHCQHCVVSYYTNTFYFVITNLAVFEISLPYPGYDDIHDAKLPLPHKFYGYG